MLPSLVAHADWGTGSCTRWIAKAALNADRVYCARSPEEAGVVKQLLVRLCSDCGPDACIALGFDFPIGLPMFYAKQAGISEFRAALPLFGKNGWAQFFSVAEKAQEIGLRRPFYPLKSGKKGEQSKRQLLDALRATRADDLLRQCERKHSDRAAAGCLFWTLGPKQVGKAAICGWRDLIIPALEADAGRVFLWPFDGELAQLLQPGCVVIAETYPAEYYQRVLGERKQTWSKQRQEDRKAVADAMLTYAKNTQILLDPALRKAIADGFGSTDCGEDRFDAVVGLFAMIKAVTDRDLCAASAPDDMCVRKVEGWILGQSF